MRIRYGLLTLALLTVTAPARAQTSLTVAAGQPTGELSSLEQAAEVRVRFSEPMVPLGRLPDQVTAPFFSIRPAVTGTFRWASPTLLVFTPDPKKPLPHATRYDVTIAAAAKAVSGRTLGRPFAFSFTTPTVRLLETRWYRLNGRFDRPAIVALRFNQPVRPADVAAHVTMRYQRHEWERPTLTADERTRMGAEAARFDTKVEATLAVVNSQSPIASQLAADWDKKRIKPGPDLVVFQTADAPSTDGWVRVTVDNRVPGAEGTATPARAQSFTIQLEPTLFVDDFRCQASCDADGYNPAHLRSSDVALDALVRAVSVRDLTRRDRETPVARPAAAQRTPEARQETVSYFTFEDLGYDRQPPAQHLRGHDRLVAQGRGRPGARLQLDGRRRELARPRVHQLRRRARRLGNGRRAAAVLLAEFRRRLAVGESPHARSADADDPRARQGQLQDGAARRRRAPAPRRRARCDPLVRPRRVARAVAVGHRSGVGGRQARPADRAGPDVQRAGHGRRRSCRSRTSASTSRTARRARSCSSPASTRARRSRGAQRLDRAPRQRDGVERPDRRHRRRRRAADAAAPAESVVGARLHRDGGEGRGRRLRRQRLERRHRAVRVRAAVRPRRGGAAPARHGLLRPRRVQAGEDVHIKAILRRDTPSGIELVPNATPVYVAVRDSHNKLVDQQTVAANAWSSTEWTVHVPDGGALGGYDVLATLDKSALEERAPQPPAEDADEDEPQPWRQMVRGELPGRRLSTARLPRRRHALAATPRWRARSSRAWSAGGICSAPRWRIVP